MSEQRFKEARGALAFSQNLRSQMNAPMGQEMAQEAPQEGQMSQEAPQAETTPTEPNMDVQSMIQKAIAPINEKLDKLLSMEKKEQEVELKIPGTMSSVDEESTEPKQ